MYYVCILDMLLKIASHYQYDLSALHMSMMGFQKSLDKRVGLWGELYPFFGILDFLNFAKPL